MENKIQTSDSVLLSNIYSDTCTIIEDARDRAYRAVNTALTIRNWMLGERIAREHLGDNGRAEYGKYMISSLAEMLTKKYGKGFDFSSLYQYVKFYECFPLILDAVRPKLQSSNNQQNEIVDAVSPKSQKVDAVRRQLLPWTLYRELIRVENVDARNWYAQEAAREVWSSRTLHRNIASQYYFRMIQSQAKERVAEEMHKLTAPYQQDKLEFTLFAHLPVENMVYSNQEEYYDAISASTAKADSGPFIDFMLGEILKTLKSHQGTEQMDVNPNQSALDKQFGITFGKEFGVKFGDKQECDRIADYRTAWAHFEKIFNKF